MEAESYTMATSPEDIEISRAWTGRLLSAPESLPVSFVYAGQKISGIPAGWQPEQHRRRIDANLVETVFSGVDPASGLSLRVEVLEYLDFPVVEWVAWLENTGSRPSLLIENLLALDDSFAGSGALVDHCNGDFYNIDGYTPQETPLPPGAALAFAPTGGRPCDGAFPYFRVKFPGRGFTLAVGWPAQWSASFSADGERVHITAGQEITHLRLNPGEKIRTPRMTVLSWTGDSTRAVNLWRRWYLAHILPKPDGRPLQPKLACAATDPGEEFTQATEANQLAYMERFRAAGIDFDVWWIDAGWYPCLDEQGAGRWWRTGSWYPDPARFPGGFAKISASAARRGASLLVWFEPERVHAGSQLDRERPEWLLKAHPQAGDKPDVNRLLDLGNPACRQWLTDHVCQLIAANGIHIYRQDFNFPPLAYWRDNDAADRQGMHENLHVQGYLQYWDDLLTRNPGLWIDSCSSGGRRNDLETMRRSVPLHYTDYGYGDHQVKLAFHHTLYAWIPYFKECTLSWDVVQPEEDHRFDKQVDRFSFHCGMAPMLFSTQDIRRDDYDLATAVQMIAVWRAASEILLHGDYYPLTPFSKSASEWLVRQFDMPERQQGFIQGIRMPQCPAESITVRPHVSGQGCTYAFENPETGEKLELSAEQLARDGFTFSLPARCAAIWLYKRIT